MTPIERAARAICDDFGVDPDSIVTGEEDAHVGLGLREPHLAWTRYVSMARSVIQAVREPSVPMVTMVHSDGNWSCTSEEIGKAYTAVIDAILETKH